MSKSADEYMFNIYTMFYDKFQYPPKIKIEEQTQELLANIEDNIYRFSDGVGYQAIGINGNIFYYKYSSLKEDKSVDHFGEYEYKLDGGELYIRGLYIKEDYYSQIVDGGSGHKIMFKIDGGWDVWEGWNAWGSSSDKNSYKKEKTEGGWMRWGSEYSSKAREIILNYAEGNKDLNSKYKGMLIPKPEVLNIVEKYISDIDVTELHFSKLYKSRSKNYDSFLFHRKNSFKFDSDCVVIVSKHYKDPSSRYSEYVLKFKNDELKWLFNQKKKKNGEKSDFIRIRFLDESTGYKAAFELGNGELYDISKNLVEPHYYS